MAGDRPNLGDDAAKPATSARPETADASASAAGP